MDTRMIRRMALTGAFALAPALASVPASAANDDAKSKGPVVAHKTERPNQGNFGMRMRWNEQDLKNDAVAGIANGAFGLTKLFKITVNDRGGRKGNPILRVQPLGGGDFPSLASALHALERVQAAALQRSKTYVEAKAKISAGTGTRQTLKAKTSPGGSTFLFFDKTVGGSTRDANWKSTRRRNGSQRPVLGKR